MNWGKLAACGWLVAAIGVLVHIGIEIAVILICVGFLIGLIAARLGNHPWAFVGSIVFCIGLLLPVFV